MNAINCLESNYYKACELKNVEYDLKLKELHQLCNDLKMQSQILDCIISLKDLLNEIFKVGTLISEIKFSDKGQEEKESLLEHCRLMIEVHLGQALILEMENNKR